MVADFDGIWPRQLVFYYGVPRVRPDWRVTHPNDELPQTHQKQTTDGNLGDY